MALEATVMEDGRPLGPMVTGRNGIGDMLIIPRKGAAYSIVLADAKKKLVNPVFSPVLDSGFVIGVTDGMVADSSW